MCHPTIPALSVGSIRWVTHTMNPLAVLACRSGILLLFSGLVICGAIRVFLTLGRTRRPRIRAVARFRSIVRSVSSICPQRFEAEHRSCGRRMHPVVCAAVGSHGVDVRGAIMLPYHSALQSGTNEPSRSLHVHGHCHRRRVLPCNVPRALLPI